jgi:S-adenosylmethionine:tRNA ribosyltransferase-isomerase
VDVRDFDFALPEELIAQYPPPERGQSRLLVLPRAAGPIEHTTFPHLVDHLRKGDLLVTNDTRVCPARLLGHRVPTGGAVECLLMARLPDEAAAGATAGEGDVALCADAPAATATGLAGDGEHWDALMHPGQKLKPGARVVFERDGARLHGEVVGRHFHGRRTIRLWAEGGDTVAAVVERIGHIPLPPYITRADEALDHERYQTVYGRARGSIAAPTAGLHFTPSLLDALAARGIEHVSITLHVGYGTFKPVRVERVEEHQVDPEVFTVSAVAADALTRARREDRRIIAVGTTTTRALESLPVGDDGTIPPSAGSTQLFIYPGHQCRLVQGLVTNFHLPGSSLLMLVAAFGGRERVIEAYREAVARGYRFYSYGDAMLIL